VRIVGVLAGRGGTDGAARSVRREVKEHDGASERTGFTVAKDALFLFRKRRGWSSGLCRLGVRVIAD
jgi:hypothetical protein